MKRATAKEELNLAHITIRHLDGTCGFVDLDAIDASRPEESDKVYGAVGAAIMSQRPLLYEALGKQIVTNALGYWGARVRLDDVTLLIRETIERGAVITQRQRPAEMINPWRPILMDIVQQLEESLLPPDAHEGECDDSDWDDESEA